jgi:hypothetical protein
MRVGQVVRTSAELYPGNDRSEGSNRYTDFGYDAAYRLRRAPGSWNVNFAYIHEDQNLGASYDSANPREGTRH